MTAANEHHCVIVGASHAGVQVALRTRRFGWSGRITLVGAEPALPYQRPPLTKDYLKGDKPVDRIALSPQSVYAKSDIELRLGRPVAVFDPDARCVRFDDGDALGYDRLVLATGARPRTLTVPGSELDRVHLLRTLADVDAIRAGLHAEARAVVIGGGYIGLEAAASLRSLGLAVSVLEAETRVLSRVTRPEVSRFFERLHREEGCEVLTGARVVAFEGEAAVRGVRLEDGRHIPADLALVGVGIVPNVELAAAAGLDVDDGICVDAHGRTSAPDIFAAGDCTSFEHPRYAGRVRLESVQNANDQATVVARALCGEPQIYDALPWFWSDQYDVRLQIAGLAKGYDATTLRGDPGAGRDFAVAYLREERLIALDAVNRTRDFVQARQLIDADARMDPARLADPETELADAVLG